ncbi:PREDICTED: spermatogenesis-associated protein 31E1-like [Propithecus coquereli]|uniref:spermatogenesis-associated protein 31E1-like n=1 Tax=Propithecus coquereli TaxID=379532 RepID=UPI00063F9D05|nr:PREDICTED: spermatogenesis-associated protein 31E1-like [Propithecus coquereli]
MENHLFSLKSFSASWLSPSSTSWAVHITLGFLSSSGEEAKAREQEELCPESHLGQLPDKGDFHQLSCPDPLGEACKPAPASAHRPHGEQVEDASPTTSTLLAFPAPLTEHPPPLASTLSVEPQGDQSDLKRVPPPPRALSRRAHLQKLLEILITKRAELKLWKQKEKEGPFLKQMSPDYPQAAQGNVLVSPSQEQSTTATHGFWNMTDKPEQLPGPQQLPRPKAVGDHLPQKCSQLFWGLPSLHSESLVAAAWEKAQFLIPTKSEHLEWPLQKQLRWKRILPSLLKNAQEGAGREHQEQQEQYTQRSFIPDKHESGPPRRSQASGELMQPQGEFLGTSQSQPPVLAAGESSKESRRTASHAIVKSDTLTKPRNLASWRGWKCCVNTSQELFFLDPCAQLMLEAHITRFRVSEFGDNSIAGVANFLGERPWKGPGEKVIKEKSVLTLTGFLSAPSPVGEEVQRDLTGTQSGDNRGHSEAPLTGQEGRWPSQPLTCSFMSRTWQSTTVLGTGRGSPELGPSPAMARHEPWEEKESVASGDPCSSTAMLELTVGSQSSGAKETMEPVEAEEKTPAWEVTVGASVMADSQTANVNPSSGSLRTSKSSPLSRISGTQDPGELHLKAQVVSKFEFKVQVETENQLQGPATDVLLQDCATGLRFRGRHTNMLPPEDMLPSQAPLSGSQNVPSRDTSASQGFCDPTWKGGSSQGQQEPRSPKVKALWKSQSKMLGPTDKRPKRGQQEQTAAGPRASQASGMRLPVQVREIGETRGSKYSQFLGKKGQAPPESHSTRRISHGLQCLDPSKKGTRQEAPLQKGKPASAKPGAQGRPQEDCPAGMLKSRQSLHSLDRS